MLINVSVAAPVGAWDAVLVEVLDEFSRLDESIGDFLRLAEIVEPIDCTANGFFGNPVIHSEPQVETVFRDAIDINAQVIDFVRFLFCHNCFRLKLVAECRAAWLDKPFQEGLNGTT